MVELREWVVINFVLDHVLNSIVHLQLHNNGTMYVHRYHYSTLFFAQIKAKSSMVCMDYVAYCSKYDSGRIARLVAIHRLVSVKCLAPKI